MRLIVQKFGGSSVATTEKLHKVASRIVETRRQGAQVVVVVSAMGKTTDDLLDLAVQVTDDPAPRELDLLLASGEQVSSSLLAMAVQRLGEDAVALTGAQSGIVTSEVHGGARVQEVRTDRIREELGRGRIVIVAGFQGINAHSELTTLGRGGSDTSAVALAGALEANRCQIFTDVDGVFSADPRVVPKARRIEAIGYEEMLALAHNGARVLHAEAVELARRQEVPLQVLSTFGGNGGTRIGCSEAEAEICAVSGVAGRKDLLSLTGQGQKVRQRVLEQVLLASGTERVVSLDGNGQAAGTGNGNGTGTGTGNGSRSKAFRLLVPGENIADTGSFAARLQEEFPNLQVATELGSVSAVGRFLGSRQQALRHSLDPTLPAPALGCFTSPVSLSWVVQQQHVDDAARRLHEALIEEESFSELRAGAA